MTERVYTFQQNLLIQDIEALAILYRTPGSSRRAKMELFKSIQRAVYNEKTIPDRLKPDQYFNHRRTTWRGRAMTPVIKAWLIELHKYLDDSHKRTAFR